jgi:hypothetical protein
VLDNTVEEMVACSRLHRLIGSDGVKDDTASYIRRAVDMLGQYGIYYLVGDQTQGEWTN